jgi:hypothetical protein
MMATTDRTRGIPVGVLSGLVFFTVVLSGCGYIVFSKLQGFSAIYVTLVPVLFMIGYALLLGLARLFRLRDDQSGDNLYYMGFLFTLTSLAVSLYQFSTAGSPAQIVQNFGIAIASTIAGIALRIFFNQMRRDPIEVEHTARLELAQASRKVKREMESSVLEFSHFRRAAQQAIQDALDEMTAMLAEAKSRFVGQLEEFATTSSKPIEEASKRSADAIERLNTRISTAMDDLAIQISTDGSQLSKRTAAVVKAIDGVVSKLTSLQTPEKIIEIKLNPTIQGLSRVVNNFGKNAETQARAVDANLQQTQQLLGAVTALLSEIRDGPALGGAPSSGTNRPPVSLSQPVAGALDREQRG